MVSSSVDKFRKNPWVWPPFFPWTLLAFAGIFDAGHSYGSFRFTSWYIVFGLSSGSAIGVLSTAAFLQRPLQMRWIWMQSRLGKRTRTLGLTAGVVVYLVTFVSALVALVEVFLQMIGVGNPDLPLPIWSTALLLGLLVSTAVILGSQLPFEYHPAPNYEPMT